VGAFSLAGACSLDALREYVHAGALSQVVIPVTEALSFLPSLTLTSQQYDDLRTQRGRVVSTLLDTMQPLSQHAACYRLCIQSQRTVAVIQRQLPPAEKWRLYVTP
jgi:hypothetical protein